MPWANIFMPECDNVGVECLYQEKTNAISNATKENNIFPKKYVLLKNFEIFSQLKVVNIMLDNRSFHTMSKIS